MQDIFVPIAGMLTGMVLFLPLVRLVVRVVERRWLDRPRDADVAGLREELERLREHAAATQDLAFRMAELEERLDFAERMLAQSRRGQLPGEG